MNQELVRVFHNRSPIITVKGCSVYIGIHDQNYLNQLKAFKRLLRENHPDQTTLTGSREFRRIQSRYQRFLSEEKKWYKQFNLDPPPIGV